jgi:hypothetical protein
MSDRGALKRSGFHQRIDIAVSPPKTLRPAAKLPDPADATSNAGWLLLLACAAAIGLAALWAPTQAASMSLVAFARDYISPVEVETHIHPILTLLTRARRRHTRLINDQSKTYAKAVAQYRARYGKVPPSTYQAWYTFASARNHTLIDEYDSLMRDLAPFAALPPRALRLRTTTLGALPGVSIISIRNGQSEIHSKSGRWAPALAFQEMMADFVKDLPDMDVAINEQLEGRVLPESRPTTSLDRDDTDSSDNSPFCGTTAERIQMTFAQARPTR